MSRLTDYQDVLLSDPIPTHGGAYDASNADCKETGKTLNLGVEPAQSAMDAGAHRANCPSLPPGKCPPTATNRSSSDMAALASASLAALQSFNVEEDVVSAKSPAGSIGARCSLPATLFRTSPSQSPDAVSPSVLSPSMRLPPKWKSVMLSPGTMSPVMCRLSNFAEHAFKDELMLDEPAINILPSAHKITEVSTAVPSVATVLSHHGTERGGKSKEEQHDKRLSLKDFDKEKTTNKSDREPFIQADVAVGEPNDTTEDNPSSIVCGPRRLSISELPKTIGLITVSEAYREKYLKSKRLVETACLIRSDDPDAGCWISSIAVVYFTGWSCPHIHYTMADNKHDWTAGCGASMTAIKEEPYLKDIRHYAEAAPESTAWVLHLPGRRHVEFVPNDGTGRAWDKAHGGTNYVVSSPGVYSLCNGVLKEYAPSPGPPAFLSAVEVTATRVRLLWNPPLLNDSGSCSILAVDCDDCTNAIAGYQVLRDDADIAFVRAPSTSYVDTTVCPMATHVYRVRAVCREQRLGKLSEKVVVATPESAVPSAPTKCKCVAQSPSAIKLTWEEPAHHGEANIKCYLVYRDGKLHAISPATPQKVQSWKDDGTIEGESYTYFICASNRFESPPRPRSPMPAIGALPSSSPSVGDVATSVRCGPASLTVHGTAWNVPIDPSLDDRRTHIILKAFDPEAPVKNVSW
eukprot:GHVT01015221.1.p1 GENE.GHVT01015221.1~~GHVT01015221.1.p1  ORF type:complete len:690 (-),score=78.20 GHVT01015221.1:4866-6935(-)